MASPLDGIRVLEIASYITGPYAAQLLGDLGAKVIKVEDPRGGDPFRSWSGTLYGPHYIGYNRSKQSLTLNLRHEAAREVVDRLLPETDVLIANFRPGVAEKLGIGYARVHALNPRLVYCAISGVGATGPYAHRPVYDTVGQGLSGLMSLFSDPDNPRPAGPPLADGLTGVFACYGIMAALHARATTGRGQLVEVNMLSATLGFLLEPALWYLGTGEVPGPGTRPRAAQVYAFRCADGKSLAIHLSSPPKFWEGLVDAVERPELREHPLFGTRNGRLEHHRKLQEELRPAFATRPRHEWLERLDARDVPCAPIQTMDEVFADPQVKHLGLLATYEHPTMGTVRSVGPAVTLSETPTAAGTAPPVLGQDTDAILERLGYDRATTERLRAEGTV